MNQNPLARTQYCNSLVIAHLVPDGWKLDRLENFHTAVLVVIEGDPPRVAPDSVPEGPDASPAAAARSPSTYPPRDPFLSE